jgi:hypothetical protein
VPAVQRQGTGFFKIISYHKRLSLRPKPIILYCKKSLVCLLAVSLL